MGVLDNLTIAVTGTHPHDAKQIRSWIDKNNGRYSVVVNKNVTHLIASKEAYKARNDAVRQATDLGIDVVSYDWFDDSLQARRKLSTRRYKWEVLTKERRTRKELKRLGKAADGKKFRDGCARIKELTGSGTSDSTAVKRKPRKNKSKSFFFDTSDPVVPPTLFVSAKEDLLRRKAERETAKADGSTASGDDEVNESEGVTPTRTTSSTTASTPNSAPPNKPSPIKKPQLLPPSPSTIQTLAKKPHWKDSYHYYHDQTGFEYKILLVRSDLTTAGFSQYNIGLLESHSKPHVYWTIAQYKPAKASPQVVDNAASNIHPEAARLQALISPPSFTIPTSSAPYQTTLCPRNSAFDTAYTVFRHAFRDLTLLTWEERFDPGKNLQKSRAILFNTEPFIYSRPKPGMPVGMFPQEQGLGMVGGNTQDEEDGYMRGSLGLPGMGGVLTRNGTMGARQLDSDFIPDPPMH
ncbi:BRCT multi-domain protein [Pyrenophora tritici-repentis]|nr:BRCT multi-domain protein [Pyrenophora tritici-repentis]PZD38449.1 BRCT multi-domain protein [Pyrenophora tritici-repentis]